MGARPISRARFIEEMKRLLKLQQTPSPWRFDLNDASY
jgi:hypothetical protein